MSKDYMNIRIKDWKDIIYLLLALISSPVTLEFFNLLCGKITRKKFNEKIRNDITIMISLIGLFLLIIFFVSAYIFNVF